VVDVLSSHSPGCPDLCRSRLLSGCHLLCPPPLPEVLRDCHLAMAVPGASTDEVCRLFSADPPTSAALCYPIPSQDWSRAASDLKDFRLPRFRSHSTVKFHPAAFATECSPVIQANLDCMILADHTSQLVFCRRTLRLSPPVCQHSRIGKCNVNRSFASWPLSQLALGDNHPGPSTRFVFELSIRPVRLTAPFRQRV